jgi:hypothetical protein
MTLSQTAHLFAYVISAAVAVGLFCGLVGKLSTRQRSSGPAGGQVAEPVRHTEVERAAALAELAAPRPPRPVAPHTAELRAEFRAARAELLEMRALLDERIAGFDRRIEARLAKLAGDDWRTGEHRV